MNDVLTRRTPSEAGVDARGILRFLDALEADPRLRPHGLVVLRDGARIAEGTWAPFEADRIHLLYSLSKSFTSTAVGFAVQEGLLDLDATVLSFFPECDADVTDPRSRAMTLRHVAAMASGHAGETIDVAFGRDPLEPVRGFLLTPPDADPGTLFAYNQLCTYSLAAVVQQVTGKRLVDYLRPRLFDPLGIGEVAWIQHPEGRDIGFSGLHATTDAVARLGELYRRGGVWGDRRLLDEEWVALATRMHIDTPPGNPDWQLGYGYQFWMSQHGYRGDGAYGQFCVVVPEAGLVVATTAECVEMQPVLDALWEHLLPAVGAEGDPAADAELAARLSTLAVPVPAVDAAPGAYWSGREFSALGPVPTVRVVVEGDDARLELVEASGVLAIPFAPGVWTRSQPGGVPVAASGGRRGDILEVDVLFLESPHSLTVTCRPDRDARVEWRTQPLADLAPSAQRRP
jgi:Beta-lactamase class C and other penicillin binding proteins